jgi:hypothetical protein
MERPTPDHRAYSRLTTSDLAVASAMEYARRMRPPMKAFVYELRQVLGLPSLSRQTLYEWESARARVPASALIAAAHINGFSVDELMRRSARATAILSAPS